MSYFPRYYYYSNGLTSYHYGVSGAPIVCNYNFNILNVEDNSHTIRQCSRRKLTNGDNSNGKSRRIISSVPFNPNNDDDSDNNRSNRRSTRNSRVGSSNDVSNNDNNGNNGSNNINNNFRNNDNTINNNNGNTPPSNPSREEVVAHLKNHTSMGAGAIVGITLVGLAILIVIIALIYFRNRKNHYAKSDIKVPNSHAAAYSHRDNNGTAYYDPASTSGYHNYDDSIPKENFVYKNTEVSKTNDAPLTSSTVEEKTLPRAPPSSYVAGSNLENSEPSSTKDKGNVEFSEIYSNVKNPYTGLSADLYYDKDGYAHYKDRNPTPK